MIYSADREELNKLLLNIKGNKILDFEDEILQLVPELIVCKYCKHEHIAHKYNVYIHTLNVVACVNSDLIIKLAALFHDIGKPYVKKMINGSIHYWNHGKVSVTIANLVLNRLGYSKNIIDDVCTLIEVHDEKIEPTLNDIKLFIDKIGKVNFEKLLELQISDISAHADEYAEKKLPTLLKLKKIYLINKFNI